MQRAGLAALGFAVVAFWVGTGWGAEPRLLMHEGVDGRAVPSWNIAGGKAGARGTELTFSVTAGDDDDTLELPVCAGVQEASMDEHAVPRSGGPTRIRVTPGPHTVRLRIAVSGYEKTITCGDAPQIGRSVQTREGLSTIGFASPARGSGAGSAVVYVPKGHAFAQPGALLVGLHPWNGSIWTYAAYSELLRAADAHDVVLLMPSGLGNSLYTAAAEDEVLRAIDALSAEVPIDPKRVSLWGASMGGAGATTIGFHHPDRFASITSFFGDSRYDRSTYVRSLLPTEAAAHLVNALDIVDNARHLPVWLIHGEADRISPIRQSEMLSVALQSRHFSSYMTRVPERGHEGALVRDYAGDVVLRAKLARSLDAPPRVSFTCVRPGRCEAYGVSFEREHDGDATIDIDSRSDGIHVLCADNIRALALAPGALGAGGEAPFVFARGVKRCETARR